MEATHNRFREAYKEAKARGEDVILYSGIVPVEAAFSSSMEIINLGKYSNFM